MPLPLAALFRSHAVLHPPSLALRRPMISVPRRLMLPPVTRFRTLATGKTTSSGKEENKGPKKNPFSVVGPVTALLALEFLMGVIMKDISELAPWVTILKPFFFSKRLQRSLLWRLVDCRGILCVLFT